MYVCMYVCMYIRMYVCRYICIYVCTLSEASDAAQLTRGWTFYVGQLLQQALAAEQQRCDRDALERISSLGKAHGRDAQEIVANMIDCILAR